MKELFRRRVGVAGALVALLTIAVLAGATSVRAGDISFNVSVSDTPDPVAWTPVGAANANLVAYPIVVENRGPSNATHVDVHLPSPQVCTFSPAAPASATACTKDAPAVYATLDSILLAVGSGSPSDITSSCADEGTGGKVCSLGTVRADATMTVTGIYQTPAVGAGLTFTPSVTAKDGAVQTSAQHAFTDQNPEADGAGEWTTLGRTADQNGTYVKPNTGATITTDPNDNPNGAASPSNKHVSNVTINGGSNGKGVGALIRELTPASGDPGCGATTCFPLGQLVRVNVGNGASFDPHLGLFFRVDALVTGGIASTKVRLWHEGFRVLNCPWTATGDPFGSCISGYVKFSDKDAGLLVDAPANGDWRFS